MDGLADRGAGGDGVDHDVVPVADIESGTQPFRCGLLVGVTGADRGGDPPVAEHRGSGQADGTCTDDQHPVGLGDSSAVQCVGGDRKWLDQTGVFECQSRWQGDECVGVHDDLVGHTARQADAVEDRAVRAEAQVALVACPATATSRHRFDCDRGAVGGDAAELVAEDHALGDPAVEQVQVAPADRRTHHLHANAVALRPGEGLQGRGAVDDSYCAHRLS